MNILILTDVEKSDSFFYEKYMEMLEQLKGNIVNIFNTKENKIFPCLSCYKCWVEHPGICHIRDDLMKFTQSFYSSDIFIIFTRICFGCYSAITKKYMERLIINMLPFFEKRAGRMYHQKRYSKIPQYIMMGYTESLTEFEKETFYSLVKRNVINLGQDVYKAIIIDKSSTYMESGDISEG